MRLPLHQRQALYEAARDFHGLTIEEWEDEQGYPPFSVFPQGRIAWQPVHAGYFMYARDKHDAAITEEIRQMRCLLDLGLSNRDCATIFEWPYFRVWDYFNGKSSSARYVIASAS